MGAAAGLVLMATLATVQTQSGGSQSVLIPKDASALEGVPTVRLDVTGHGTKRQELDRKHAAAEALKIEIVDGRYYWTSREKQRLTVTTSGEFTYLTSTEPGKYVRFKKLNDRISYVEHVDMDLGSVTYWGELRIVVGK
jgi:hypothetical protein